jgi:hypothetical protein
VKETKQESLDRAFRAFIDWNPSGSVKEMIGNVSLRFNLLRLFRGLIVQNRAWGRYRGGHDERWTWCHVRTRPLHHVPVDGAKQKTENLDFVGQCAALREMEQADVIL